MVHNILRKTLLQKRVVPTKLGVNVFFNPVINIERGKENDERDCNND